MSTRKEVKEMSRLTGLSRRTIRGLMKKGWTYHMGYKGVPYFQHPAGTMRER